MRCSSDRLDVGGHGPLQLVRGAGAAPALSGGGKVLHLRRGARAYTAESCDARSYSRTAYSALRLLGSTLSVTVDVSSAGCGCVAAFYLVPMHSNRLSGTCNGDRYCDANSVCGVQCSEIDVVETNRHALLTTAHTADDCYGKGNGLGGSNSAFTPSEFGPGGAVVDTNRPFRLHAHFVESRQGLAALEVTVQGGGPQHLRFDAAPRHCLQRHTRAVRDGLTLVLSYWSSSAIGWFDVPPCARDDEACGGNVTFADVAIASGPPRLTTTAFTRPSALGDGGGRGSSRLGNGGRSDVWQLGRSKRPSWQQGGRANSSLAKAAAARGGRGGSQHGGVATGASASGRRLCIDEPAWENGSGKTCADYAQLWCSGGAFHRGAEWTGGPKFQSPEAHCCACGRKAGTLARPARPKSKGTSKGSQSHAAKAPRPSDQRKSYS